MATFYGKPLYRYYNIKEGRSDYECLKRNSEPTDFVVQVVTPTGRYYMKFISHLTFYSWFITVPDNERTLSEVILHEHGGQKFRVDIDENVDNIDFVEEKIKTMLTNIGIEKPSLLVFDIETSYHIVLTNYYFMSNRQCRTLAMYLATEISGIDTGIYNKLQHFRLEGCTKYGQTRWKRRTRGTMTMNNFHEGVISSIEDTKVCTIIIPDNKKPKNISRSRMSSVEISSYPEFSIRWTSGHLVVLDRISPSYCKQCDRVHDNDGAYLLRGIFHCRRKYSQKKDKNY